MEVSQRRVFAAMPVTPWPMGIRTFPMAMGSSPMLMLKTSMSVPGSLRKITTSSTARYSAMIRASSSSRSPTTSGALASFRACVRRTFERMVVKLSESLLPASMINNPCFKVMRIHCQMRHYKICESETIATKKIAVLVTRRSLPFECLLP